MKRLIILEDNLDFSRTVLNCISKKIQKIDSYSLLVDGEEIVDKLEELNNNDIVLLDLEMPKVNGITILNLLKMKKINPYVIIISGNSTLMQKLHEYEEFIFSIFQKPFNIDKLVNTIYEILSLSNEDSIDMRIRNELSLFNFNRATVGYTYLLECIKLALDDNELLKDIQNNLYSKVSQHHNESNMFKVKWSIQKTIDGLYKTTNICILNNYFFIEMQQKLTPKIFITTVVDKLSYNL